MMEKSREGEEHKETNDPHEGTAENTKQKQTDTVRKECQSLSAPTQFNETGFIQENQDNGDPSAVQEKLSSLPENNQQLENKNFSDLKVLMKEEQEVLDALEFLQDYPEFISDQKIADWEEREQSYEHAHLQAQQNSLDGTIVKVLQSLIQFSHQIVTLMKAHQESITFSRTNHINGGYLPPPAPINPINRKIPINFHIPSFPQKVEGKLPSQIKEEGKDENHVPISKKGRVKVARKLSNPENAKLEQKVTTIEPNFKKNKKNPTVESENSVPKEILFPSSQGEISVLSDNSVKASKPLLKVSEKLLDPKDPLYVPKSKILNIFKEKGVPLNYEQAKEFALIALKESGEEESLLEEKAAQSVVELAQKIKGTPYEGYL